jgi:hypothetical protein
VALNFPGDLDLLKDGLQVQQVGVVAVLYKHPQSITGLQFMAEAAGLRRNLGGVSYRVLAATVGMHKENQKLPGVQLLTEESAILVPLVVKDFSAVYSNGDVKAMFAMVAEVQSRIRPKYDVVPGGA